MLHVVAPKRGHTLQRQSLALVLLKHVCRFPLDRLIAVCFRFRHLQRLAIQLESIHFLDCLKRRLLAVKDDKCLTLAFQTALGDDVEYGAVVLEDFGERLLHGVDLDTLLKVVHLVLSASRYDVQCRHELRSGGVLT